MEPGAYTLTNSIEPNTTPEEFDKILAEAPDGYKLSYGGRCGWNALGAASVRGNVSLVEYIVRIGNPELLDLGNEFGMTPLFCCASGEDQDKALKVARKLIELGADINLGTRYPSGDTTRGDTPSMATPLWECLERSHNRKLAKYLIQNGAEAIKLSQEGKDLLKELISEIRGRRLFLAAYFKPDNSSSIINALPKDLIRHIYCNYLTTK